MGTVQYPMAEIFLNLICEFAAPTRNVSLGPLKSCFGVYLTISKSDPGQAPLMIKFGGFLKEQGHP